MSTSARRRLLRDFKRYGDPSNQPQLKVESVFFASVNICLSLQSCVWFAADMWL
jgi:hypothetical protein